MGQGSTSDGFAAFYEAEVVRQVRSATLILGSRPAAQDVVHDVFVEMYQRWAGGIVEPGLYLRPSGVNRGRVAHRRLVTARRLPAALRPEDVPEIVVPLYDALATLPFKQRTALVLRYYLGLTEAEIAEALGCPTGSVGPWI